MHPPIKKAVIPIAGMGTRFLPATKSVPKALLPVLNKPLIHYAVEEVAKAGITEIAFVASPGMEQVAKYFSPNADLYGRLKAAGKGKLVDNMEQADTMCRTTLLTQHEPLGLGHAILQARDWVGNHPFAVLLPDDLVWNEVSAIQQLVDVYEKLGGQVIAAVKVSDSQVPFKGIIEGSPSADERLYAVSRLVEKPRLEDAPSNLSILGRYILSPDIFDLLADGKAGTNGEIQVTDGIEASIKDIPLHALEVKGVHVDAGEPLGMVLANICWAQGDPTMHKEVARFIQSINLN